MKNFFFIIIVLFSVDKMASAQGIDDLNIQLHGYATQGFVYSNRNSWNTTDSENGSAAWTEAVLNLSTQPDPKLRIGVQARYFLLGDYGNNIALDWAQADYRINDRVGFRFGKVKTPSGMLNEVQDIDPAQLWILLPQAVYPIASRTTLLSHWGGVVYGSQPLGDRWGKLEYRGFAGNQSVDAKDGVLQPERDNGLTFPNGLGGKIYGATLHWKTPIPGLMLGASMEHERHTGEVTNGAVAGNFDSGPFISSFYFGSYEHKRFMFAGEYNRFPPNPVVTLPGLPPNVNPSDARNWYLMTSYKIAPKFTAGAYYSYTLDLKAPLDMNRYQKDWTLSGRYDFTSSLYLKVEQHFVNGTQVGFSALDNPNLQTRFDMTLLKLGVIF